ncbi:unnamed protein product [Dibothriocephalus latus]|uniref:Uncharacterized protein n=1 Tax=Dibothriocephalus latus TaxID=60516 RepID=A0A3P6P092_DIBLA|nr:unnamed protein product [Dibothriocephalus latus]
MDSPEKATNSVSVVDIEADRQWYETKRPFTWVYKCLNEGLRRNPVRGIHPRPDDIDFGKLRDNDESQPAEEEAKAKADNVQFSSTLSIILSCVGAVVGSGNIWLYPRIAAQNSHSEGAFAFVLVWIFSVFLWAIPVIVIEYAIGRFTRSGPLLAFRKFLGPKLMWIGGWVTMTTFFIRLV